MIFSGEKSFKYSYKKWYEASAIRFSTRDYNDKAVEKNHKDRLDGLVKKINELNEGITLKIAYSSKQDMFSSFMFTQLNNVPAFAAIFTDGSKGSFEKAGFYGEALCLEMTSLNIKSCWVSGSIKKQNLKDYMETDKGTKFLTSIAFGYGEERTLSEVALKRKRKPMEKLFEYGDIKEKDLKVLECAANAPSAMNRQPWRYELKEDILLLKKPLIQGGPYPAELDMGMSMMHVSCAANALKINAAWEEEKGYIGKFNL